MDHSDGAQRTGVWPAFPVDQLLLALRFSLGKENQKMWRVFKFHVLNTPWLCFTSNFKIQLSVYFHVSKYMYRVSAQYICTVLKRSHKNSIIFSVSAYEFRHGLYCLQLINGLFHKYNFHTQQESKSYPWHWHCHREERYFTFSKQQS